MSLQPRPLPEETVDGLRPPRPGFPFFAHADRFPFQPHARSYWPVNAWWLADASFLVYGTAEFIEAAVRDSPLPEAGFRLDLGGALATLAAAHIGRGSILFGTQVATSPPAPCRWVE